MVSAERPAANKRFPRGGEEFSRVLAFSDGMFAIAMTLLVVGIGVPTIANADSGSDLADALNDMSEEFVTFGISFAVIARYWVAHHQMFSLLGAFDPGMIGLNLLYLAGIAFVPFPTALLGEYFGNPVAVSVYAAVVAIVSGLEVVLFRHAYRNQLLARPMPEQVYRWGLTLSLSPVVTFAVSIPFAFISSFAAVAVWLLGIPIGILLSRREPLEATEYYS